MNDCLLGLSNKYTEWAMKWKEEKRREKKGRRKREERIRKKKKKGRKKQFFPFRTSSAEVL